MLIAEPGPKVAAHSEAAAAASIAVGQEANNAAAKVVYSAVLPEPQNAVPPALDNEAQAAVVTEGSIAARLA